MTPIRVAETHLKVGNAERDELNDMLAYPVVHVTP